LRALDSRALESFQDRGPGSLRNLLFAILDNVMRDACRRRSAQKRGGGHAPPVSLDARGWDASRPLGAGLLASDETTPTGAARAKELLALCRSVLAPAEWEVWKLAELEGLDSTEVAQRVGSTPGSVRSKVRRIRAKLIAEIASREDAGGWASP
jgi:RNA polymerase sigma factor (sigma-70 family)